MLLSPSSIGRRLLYSFIAIASLMVMASLIGIAGFSLVAKTERQLADKAIPAMLEARQVSELSSRIVYSAQLLANSESPTEVKRYGQTLFAELNQLLTHIKLLGSDAFDSTLLDRLESNVQNIIDNLAELGLAVEKRLKLNDDIGDSVEYMRLKADELEGLARTQVLNSSTVAVANVAHVYDLLESNNSEAAYNALDTLVEVDMDLTERLHELHLLALRLLTQIEEVKSVTVFSRIQELKNQFDSNLTIMERRVRSVEDPTRSVKMSGLIDELQANSQIFEKLMQRYQNEELASSLNARTHGLFAELNNIVGRLVDESNQSSTEAIENVSKTLSMAQWTLILLSMLGLSIVGIIIWKVVYQSVVVRLNQYSRALLNVAEGKLELDIDVKGKDELADMGRAIIVARDTAKTLKVVAEGEAEAKQELERHKEHLEEIVDQRTQELKHTNQKLNVEVLNHAKARNEAERANRAKSAFLATISHEIRTPLNGVLGTASLLKETSLSEEQLKYTDIINRSGSSLLSIINDVLDYSKIEAGHLKVAQHNFDLVSMVGDISQLLSSRATEKRLNLYQEVDPEIGRYFLGDSVRISQVLTNLIGNAIKFTDQGEVDVYVGRDTNRPNHIYFEVSDTGIGIEETALDTLFEAFTQASGGEGKVGGTGLGLAICKKLIQAMCGVIGVHSEPGEGSRFWFSLPLPVGEEPEDSPEPAILSTCRKANVLLVEDNPVNCLVAEGFLEHLGHTVTTATTGEDAKLLMMKHSFDIGLLDINLPDCNGVDLLAELRRIEQKNLAETGGELTPMIAVSAHVFSEEVAEYLASGFEAFVPKPIEKEFLANTLAQVLEGQVPDVTVGIRESDFSSTEPKLVTENAIPEFDLLDVSVIRQDASVLGKEKVMNWIEIFKQSSAQDWENLSLAFEAGDETEVKSHAHKLKGSAASLGLTALREALAEIESSSDPLALLSGEKETIKSLLDNSVEALQTLEL
ncbi:histidine kinase [Vibrio nigripulchritudo]|uniref:TMAO reductase system sensor histidine kinase/response regulator TorS n=1 Tax=Vibrio nigripulchritudo TaxID=28173 RepID=UPI00190A349C|nr:TMAO reductase system sensor histidine kinase/response regulator TorS [Vibrio nigripulchritudo]BCL72811.1 histidine kinase [Vibrio nigripulchritudo]BDU34176.1 histidine kinase [Vibrio nigripulchritudo]